MVANRGAVFSFHKQPLAFSSRFDGNDGGRQRLKLHGGKEELFWPSPLAWSAVRRSVPRISLPEYPFALRIH